MSRDIDRIGSDKAQFFSTQRGRERKLRPPCRSTVRQDRKIQHGGQSVKHVKSGAEDAGAGVRGELNSIDT